MSSPRITLARMQDVLDGPAPKPTEVWQERSEGIHKLAEMAEMDWDKIPEDYMYYYIEDMAFFELQPDLFRHIFPACLKFWYNTLMRHESAERGLDFHLAIKCGNIIEKMLNAAEASRLHQFFVDGFLDRIEAQTTLKMSGVPIKRTTEDQYVFISRLNSLCTIAPVLQPLWQEWWSFDHPGKAYCALIYASGLMYKAAENPICESGIMITESDAYLNEYVWHADNLA